MQNFHHRMDCHNIQKISISVKQIVETGKTFNIFQICINLFAYWISKSN